MHRVFASFDRPPLRVNTRVELNDGSFESFESTRPHHHIQYNPYFRAWTSILILTIKHAPLLHSSFFQSLLFPPYLLVGYIIHYPLLPH
jgi:hypothetical protein